MTDNHVLIGFRIELRTSSGELAGGMYIEDAFHTVAVPRAGDQVSCRILGDSGKPRTRPRWAPRPFMTVAAVEHYPEVPPKQPGVQVVIRIESGRVPPEELQAMEAYGWTVDLPIEFPA
jgi:hypothetical protein